MAAYRLSIVLMLLALSVLYFQHQVQGALRATPVMEAHQ